MLVSVIIPCYNCENFIEKALASLVKQERMPDEIICVDDGSTDRTAAIIQAFSATCPCRLTLIPQPNSGVSVARNTGITQAKGDILLFLDADDRFSPCFIRRAEEAFLAGYDCVYSCYTHDPEELCLKSDKQSEAEQDKLNVMTAFMYQKGRFHTGAFAYSRKLLDAFNIRFTEGACYGEDWEFTSKYIDVCSRFLCMPEKMMFYRRNPKSAMSKCTWQRVDAIYAAERVEQFLLDRSNECYHVFASYMKHRAVFSVAHAFSRFREKQLYQRLCSEFQVKKSMKAIATDPKVSAKVRAAAWSYCFSKWLFFNLTGR